MLAAQSLLTSLTIEDVGLIARSPTLTALFLILDREELRREQARAVTEAERIIEQGRGQKAGNASWHQNTG